TATPSGFSDADGDTLTYHYQWYKNDTAITGATGSTLNLATAGNGDRGDAIKVVVNATDGFGGTSGDVNDTATVVNSAPSAGTVAITPPSPATLPTLTATPSGFTDADNDTLSYVYQWYKGGVAIAGATAATLNLATAGNGDHGDAIKVVVYATDGNGGTSGNAENTVTVVNSLPSTSTGSVTPPCTAPQHSTPTTQTGITASSNDTHS